MMPALKVRLSAFFCRYKPASRKPSKPFRAFKFPDSDDQICLLLHTKDNKAEVGFFVDAASPLEAAEETRSRGNHTEYVAVEVWDGTKCELTVPLSAPDLTSPPCSGGTADLLVVDDEPMVRKITADLLRDEGFNVSEAASGGEALDKCAGGLRFDVLLTDVRMPDMSGFELANRIVEFFPSTKIIYFTGFPVKETGPLDVMRPGSELLHKPVPFIRLASAVRRALEGRVQRSGSPAR